MKYSLSNEGLIALERRECSGPDYSPSLTAYLDQGNRGTWTIGCGHTGPEVHQGLVWTLDQCRDALRADLATVETTLNATISPAVELAQNQYDTLVSFVFNIGTPRWKTSTALKRVNAGKLDQVPDAMRLFKYANGDFSKPDTGVVNRRNSEIGQWSRGAFVSSSNVDVMPEPSPWKKLHNWLQATGLGMLAGDKLVDSGTQLKALESNWHGFAWIGLTLIVLGIVWKMRKADA